MAEYHNEFQQLRTDMNAGFVRNDERFQKMDECLQQLRTDMNAGFARNDERFQKVDERFQKIDAGLARHDELLRKVDERFDLMEERLMRCIQESQEETHRYFDIVTERNQSTIQLFMEGLRSERSSRESLTERVEYLEESEVTTRNRLALLERKRR